MPRDVTYEPRATTRSPRFKLNRGLLVIASLLAVNIAVFVYHGDPRDRLPPPAVTKSSRVQANTAARSGEPARLDPTLGLRTPGEIQRIATTRLKSGQTVAQALISTGAANLEVSAALTSLQTMVDFRAMRPGHSLKARFDKGGALVSVDVLRGPVDRVRTELDEGGWRAVRLDVPVTSLTTRIEGKITSSLWDALVSTGEDPRLAMDMVEIFAWDIDFYSDVRAGDSFKLVVEKRYAEGKFLSYGAISAAEFVCESMPHRAYLHKSQGPNGDVYAYYDEQGESLRKQLLKSPLKYANVTSRFGSRLHPILGYTRAHNGIDYGVPIGTAVWSVADGRVMTAGWQGGSGKLVEIRHANGWLSQYAHLSQINVKVGQRVAQKDIIGLVGSTGLSTGPHLHYGLKSSGTFVDPNKQKFERSEPLAKEALEKFKEEVARLGGLLSGERLAHEPVSIPHEG